MLHIDYIYICQMAGAPCVLANIANCTMHCVRCALVNAHLLCASAVRLVAVMQMRVIQTVVLVMVILEPWYANHEHSGTVHYCTNGDVGDSDAGNCGRW